MVEMDLAAIYLPTATQNLALIVILKHPRDKNLGKSTLQKKLIYVCTNNLYLTSIQTDIHFSHVDYSRELP